MLCDSSRALPSEALRIEAPLAAQDAKMVLTLMIEKLQLNAYPTFAVRLTAFKSALRKPSYPSGENIRIAFRRLYRAVALSGGDEELSLVEAVASIMGERQPFGRRRPSEWQRLWEALV